MREAYELYTHADSTEVFLCINSFRLPLGTAEPWASGDFSYSALKRAPSGFYSVGTSPLSEGLKTFSKKVLTEIFGIDEGSTSEWRRALTDIPLFTRHRKCEGLVEPKRGLDNVLNDCSWLKQQTGAADEVLSQDPYLGIYAPSPSLAGQSGTSGSEVVEAQMPTFDIHFPFKLPKSLTEQQFVQTWQSIRKHFAQKTLAGIVRTRDDSSDPPIALFFGPPEHTTTAGPCKRDCVVAGRDCEVPDVVNDGPAAFTKSPLKKWIIAPQKRIAYSAIWKPIEMLSLREVSTSSPQPMVLDMVAGVAHPIPISEYWQRKWQQDRFHLASQPTGCTFARPGQSSKDIQNLEIFIAGDAAGFFRLLFQPIICNRDQFVYSSHQRIGQTVQIEVTIPPDIAEPAMSAVPLRKTGWNNFSVPANVPPDVHPAAQLTPQEWERLFEDRQLGIVM